MSKQTLTELPRIQQRGMDFDTVISEIKDILANNPNWSENWPAFYDSEAGVMLTQLMAWVMDNMSTKQDVLLNEMFLSTAQNDKNKMKLLKQIAYRPKLATSAKVQVSIEFGSTPSSFVYVTKPKGSISNRVNEICRFNSKDINGNNINWEILKILEDDTPDYLDAIVLKPGDTTYSVDRSNNNIYALQGETKYVEFTTEDSDGPYFDLNDSNIASNSIKVYITKTMEQLVEASSFISKEALDKNSPCAYVVETNPDRTLRIRFGNKNITPANKLLPAGTTISVFYRTTNGSTGNISPGFINFTKTFTDENGGTWPGTIKNNLLAFGGNNSETLEQAVMNGPLTIKTMDRAVTSSDYDIILNNNQNIFKSKTYTSSNQPEGFKNYYGRYINPQEAFSIVLLNKNYEDVPPSQYNNFPWFTTTKEPRLNERYVFDNGNYGEPVEISGTYYNMFITHTDTTTKNFRNATIFKLGEDFIKSMYTGNDENSLLSLKLSTTKTKEKFFDDIKFDLLYPNKDDYFKAINTTLTMKNNLLAADDNAKFVTAKTFSKTEPIEVGISRSRYINVSFDNKPPVLIDLWADRAENMSNDDSYYLLWTNQGVSNAKNEYGTDKTKDAAKFRNGIVELINAHFVQLTQDEDKFDNYTANTSYQYFGLRQVSLTDPITHLNADNEYEFTLKINDDLYSFVFNEGNWENCKNQYYQDTDFPVDINNWNCLKGIALMLNYVFKNNGCDLKILDSTNNFVNVEGFPLAEITAAAIENTPFDTDDDGEIDDFQNVYSSFDLVIKTKEMTKSEVKYTDKEGIEHTLKNVLWLDDEYTSDKKGFIHTIKNRTGSINTRELIPEPTQGATYENLASFETTEDSMGYFKLTSPIKGSASSVHFKLSDSNDFMLNTLRLYFNNSGYSYKAYGVKKVYLMKDNALRTYVINNGNSSSAEAVTLGSIIFENSCIYNNHDFQEVFVNFKSAKTTSFVLGSVYNNFYYSGNPEIDELLKRDIAGVEGQYMDYNLLENGVKSYFIDENKSDLDIRFTSEEQKTNSLYTIKTDLDVIKSDRVKLLTATISETVGGHLNMEIDNVSLNVDLTNVATGRDVTKSIMKAIEKFNSRNEFFKNRNTIVKDSYVCLNQVQLQSLKNNNGKITFKFPPAETEGTVEHTMKVFLGTNKTNSELYDLYPRHLFKSENIKQISEDEYFYCPTKDEPITFNYRKMVEVMEEDGSISMESREADYYITIESAINNEQKNYRFVLNKTNNSKFPDTYFYVHFINNKSYEFDEDGKIMKTDEMELQKYMDKYKISGTDIVFIKPYFKTYDIAATIKYNSNFSEAEVVANVNKVIDDLCSLKNAEIAGSISKAKIFKAIMNVNGVDDCKINYFGYNYLKREPADDVLKADFYEILCLNSSDGSTTGKILTFEAD